MQPENDPAAKKPKAPSPEIERRRKEMERLNARRAHKPNLKTIPWKK